MRAPTRSGSTCTPPPISVTLRIADDGRGGVYTEGAGINGMRERALLVNADADHRVAAG